ncbi:hypothetical protein HFO87_09310 [Rhizobium leguminosarum]|uniref:hypothetical protein n=1 Tax=Rhizobium leguminosarum TaxID=384 RepID=UPI001C98B36B|nr:hypothetical protein [Rhizobium leguminosarum]MBY5484669.1 hypothetical protein [Rhizobium leguminosarum]
MIFWDYALPGSIILLKLMLRLGTDQETNTADTLKAVLVFPVDIAFLSLSYGSAILYASQGNVAGQMPVKAVLTIAFLAVFLLLPVIIISKKSERALILEKTKKAGWLAFVGYALALSITTLSISVGGLF